jgi:hypothetical protein
VHNRSQWRLRHLPSRAPGDPPRAPLKAKVRCEGMGRDSILSSQLARITAADDHSCDELHPLTDTRHERETEDRPSKAHPPNLFTQQPPLHLHTTYPLFIAHTANTCVGTFASSTRLRHAALRDGMLHDAGVHRLELLLLLASYSSTPRPAPETSLSDDGRSHRGSGLLVDPLKGVKHGPPEHHRCPRPRSHVAY